MAIMAFISACLFAGVFAYGVYTLSLNYFNSQKDDFDDEL